MPKQNTITIDETFGEMMVSAVRYALGRQTHIVSTTTGYIASLLPQLDAQALCCIERDIRTAPSYGSENIDKPHWMALLIKTQEEINKRGLKPW